MSRLALLDVNVLIALFDPKHEHHRIAEQWLINHTKAGNQWATCPLTENGCMRILTLPKYPNRFDLVDIHQALQQACHHPSHRFLADDISLTNDLINWDKVQGHNQITDIYLIVLATHHHASFVSLDNRLAPDVLKYKSCQIINPTKND